jgi:hypothetical protein
MNSIQQKTLEKQIIDQAVKNVTAEFAQIARNKATKQFEAYVHAIARKEFAGDKTKARAAILSNKAKYGDAWKAYEASRQVKHS